MIQQLLAGTFRQFPKHVKVQLAQMLAVVVDDVVHGLLAYVAMEGQSLQGLQTLAELEHDTVVDAPNVLELQMFQVWTELEQLKQHSARDSKQVHLQLAQGGKVLLTHVREAHAVADGHSAKAQRT